MLENYFIKPETVDRIRASWIGKPIEQYVGWLAEHGYAPRNVLRRVPILVSTYAALIARATDLHRAGNGYATIAAILNQEAWRPAKRRETFNPPMVRRLLTTAGIVEPSPRRPRALPERKPDEWTIRELAEELGVPQATLYNWVQSGRLRSRSVLARGGPAKLVTADAATIAKLRA